MFGDDLLFWEVGGFVGGFEAFFFSINDPRDFVSEFLWNFSTLYCFLCERWFQFYLHISLWILFPQKQAAETLKRVWICQICCDVRFLNEKPFLLGFIQEIFALHWSILQVCGSSLWRRKEEKIGTMYVPYAIFLDVACAGPSLEARRAPSAFPSPGPCRTKTPKTLAPWENDVLSIAKNLHCAFGTSGELVSTFITAWNARVR